MPIASGEESTVQDEKAGGGSLSCRSFELARCTWTRKFDFESGSGSRQLRVVVDKFAGKISLGGRFRGSDGRIPRQVVTLDEQCMRQWLEWVLGKASKVMPFDAALALRASTIDGKTELWRMLAADRALVQESVNSSADAVAATDVKSTSWNDKHGLQNPPTCLADTKPANPQSMTGLSSSLSSSNSAVAAGSVSQGMLVFGWMDGMPSFVFSPDEQGKVYVADLTRVMSSIGVDPDYKYLIRIHEHSTKERAVEGGSYYHVGEINVAKMISDDSEIRTTEFVLFGGYKIAAEEEKGDQARKSNGFPSKAEKAFNFPRSTLRRSGVLEDFSDESKQDKVAALERYRHPGNELAAILVKGRTKDTAPEQKPEAGGWGMKFLRKQQATSTGLHIDECSESMNVVIPAGLHGGPRTASGGASSLIERWKSGGKCDCGGWDLGCPVTLLEARSTDPAGNPRSVNLVVGGSNTTLRMTNVRDGLFLVRFDRSISALQALSVAVAYVHTHNPLVQQRLHRSYLKLL